MRSRLSLIPARTQGARAVPASRSILQATCLSELRSLNGAPHADALILPVSLWWFGVPALLKAWFDPCEQWLRLRPHGADLYRRSR